MKVGIIGAMEEEILLLRNLIQYKLIKIIANCKIYFGKINNIEVILLQSNVGKTSSAIGTTLLIELYKPNLIINTGSAGSLSPLLNNGDLIISSELCYHDVDVTAFGYHIGQMVGCPKTFIIDKKLIKIAKLCKKELNTINIMFGLIVSGDSFIKGGKKLINITNNFPNAIAVDMESSAIAHVCKLFLVPFISIRSISDAADNKSNLTFKKFLNIAVKQSSLFIEKFLFKIS